MAWARPASATEETDFSDGATDAALTRTHPDQLIVRCLSYRSIANIVESDHKPVVAELQAEVPRIDVPRRRDRARRNLAAFHATHTSLVVRFVVHRA